MSGSGHARESAVTFCEQGIDGFGREFSQAYLNQSANDAAAHFIEKAIAFDRKGKKRAGLFQFTPGQAPDGGILGIARVCSERSEVVLADEARGGATHGGDVKRARDMPCRVPEQRVHSGMIPDEVAVLLASGTKARMKIA